MLKREEVARMTVIAKEQIPQIVETILFSQDAQARNLCHWLAHESARQAGIIPCSIHDLYAAMGRGETKGFTVPAINLRTLTFDTARAIFRSAARIGAGAFIFEIAKSEMGYTDQGPREYVSMILLAALAEGHTGPVFIQGDHFQAKAANYKKDPTAEIGRLKEVIDEAIAAGFYNIDIDTSTLVDLSHESLTEQQQANFEACAELTRHIRKGQPKGVTVSVGGEIGEVGKENSKPAEMDAFMDGYLPLLKGAEGISKMSIQTGTSHGGVVLPDGTLADVSIDFETLKTMSTVAREKYGMAGCVQHGASTLPDEAFNHFPKTGACEIHLATGFQNIVYEHLPEELRERIYAWTDEHCAAERKAGQTDDQFHYKLRKKALGPFKRELYRLPADVKGRIIGALEKKFDFLFRQLRIGGTKEVVGRHVKPVPIPKGWEEFIGGRVSESNGSGDD